MTLTLPKERGTDYQQAPSMQPAREEWLLEALDPLRDPDWDRLVLTHPNASIFHSAGWARVLKETYGHHPCYLGASQGGRLTALAAVMECESFPFRRRGVGLPGADRCPVLSSQEMDLCEILGRVLDHGRGRRWRYLELRGMDGRAGSYPRSMSYFSHILELDRPAANIHSGFRAGVRRAIRKAERAGVKVELRHDLDSVRAFYKLHCKTRRRHGLPPQPFGFFRSIQRNVLARDQGFVLLANLEGRPIAGAILFQFGSVATYKFAASDPAYQQHRGNDLVVWEAVRYLTGHVRTLDFGRTSLLHEGLRRFKLGFGSAEVIIDYYQYDYQRSRFIQTQDWTTGFHNRLFRWLPVPVLRILGNLLYRNMGLGVTFDLIKHCVLES